MTSEVTPSVQPVADKAEEKLLKSLRSLTSFIALGSWVSLVLSLYLIWLLIAYHFPLILVVNTFWTFIVTGLLFWCVHLLKQQSRLAFRIYPLLIASGVVYSLTLHFLIRRPFSFLNVLPYFIPALILIQLYQLQRKGILH